ncbi:TerB N-terminal domain-containing protein, partial [Roseobacter sp. HKCCA0434]|uniref:TerB N-terminal domain-containing protein n=1 Tax=Roseobacter sp. HKCCA0434 TaxID=3079297 RepID=UPI002905E2A3
MVYLIGLLVVGLLISGPLIEANELLQAVLVLAGPILLTWLNERRIKGRSKKAADEKIAREAGDEYRESLARAMSRAQSSSSHEQKLRADPKKTLASRPQPIVASPSSSASGKEPSRSAASVRKSKGTLQGWVGPGQSVEVAGRAIGDMVYVGVPPKVSGRGLQESCRAYIDPSLPVAPKAKRNISDMPYWPGYSDIGLQHRAVYLDWLADGRRRADVDPGYMFLYFYGLERRFITEVRCSPILGQGLAVSKLLSG